MSLQDFLHMDGYAAYVWPSFLVTIAVLIANVAMARSALRRSLAEAKRRLERERTGAAPEPGSMRLQEEGANQ